MGRPALGLLEENTVETRAASTPMRAALLMADLECALAVCSANRVRHFGAW